MNDVVIAGYTFAANTSTVACRHVMVGDRPVLLCVHSDDGDLQALCGASDHSSTDYLLVSLSNVLQRHPDLATLPALDIGTQASRDSPSSPWRTSKL